MVEGHEMEEDLFFIYILHINHDKNKIINLLQYEKEEFSLQSIRRKKSSQKGRVRQSREEGREVKLL